MPFAGTGRRPRTQRSRRPVCPGCGQAPSGAIERRHLTSGFAIRGRTFVRRTTPSRRPREIGDQCRCEAGRFRVARYNATALEIRRSFRRRAASASARSIRRCGALSGGGLRATSLGHQKRVVRRTKVRPRIANSGMRLMPLDRGEGRLSAARRDRAGDPVACAIESLIPANGMKPGGRAAMRVSTLAEIKGFTEARVDTRSAVRPATIPAVRR